MIDLDNLTALFKLAKEHGVSRLDLSSIDGAPVRIEFAGSPQLVEFAPGERKDPEQTEPTPFDAAAMRLAGGARKPTKKVEAT